MSSWLIDELNNVVVEIEIENSLNYRDINPEVKKDSSIMNEWYCDFSIYSKQNCVYTNYEVKIHKKVLPSKRGINRGIHFLTFVPKHMQKGDSSLF